MNTKVLIEAIGYTGSALVLVSFLMVSVVKLRIVNTIGSVIFTIYAFIIHSYPTAIMNLCLVMINWTSPPNSIPSRLAGSWSGAMSSTAPRSIGPTPG